MFMQNTSQYTQFKENAGYGKQDLTMTDTHKDLLFQIAITLTDGIGDTTARNLIAYCGSVELVFKEKKQHFLKIPGIGEKLAEQLYQNLHRAAVLQRAEQELYFIEKEKIRTLFYTDEAYPRRLKHFQDSPVLLYFKGDTNFNCNKVISVVGTRQPTEYGKKMCENFIQDLKNSGVLVISGLAYGIDVLAHKTAMAHDLDTVGVLGHGLDIMYPAVHDAVAKKMIHQGGLLTEFMSGTKPDRENFPKRNRIVAGMCDALIVIESRIKGGSLITAEIANSYNKDVFAFPGRSGDELSGGCNGFIKRNKAALIENVEDLFYAMNWEEVQKNDTKKSAQLQLLLHLTDAEQHIVNCLKERNGLHIDELCHHSQFSMSEVAGLLLQLEFNNIVKSLPGKVYTLI